MDTHSREAGTGKLVFTSLTACLVLLGTLLFRIPIPMTQGYVHLGDAMIFIGVLILGKKQGAFAAALGSALGDILGGFAFWAPWSFIIKYAMAFVTGSLIERTHKVTSMATGGLVMCAGYLIAERIMYGSWALAAVGLPWNIGQFATGIAVALAAQPLFRFIPSPNV
ncbi:MAG: ECF transporter S component [Mogibacterium sp.]|nr:ECF transporter S component [Mogibacterium sp.]